MKRLAVLLLLVFAGCVQQQAPEQVSDFITLTVRVNNSQSVTEDVVELPRGSTAFDAFSEVAVLDYSTHPVYGVFVEGINGVEGSVESGYFWQYYVDGELAPVGVDSFVLNESATLEFRYEKPPEFW
ncbi:MAG: DUF4430 domain-containing protein [Candidatus Diapherotrites archaeon]|nr:DUF4430 domain-containing protein [Candidatus Diapherotrites archaeon]